MTLSHGRHQPRVAVHKLLQPDGSEREIAGKLLGHGTSRREYHNHPEPRNLVTHPETWKCSACRWFEVNIIYVPEDDLYAVYTIGKSELPHERARARIQFTESAFEIIEILTDRRKTRQPDGTYVDREPRLPIAAARCIAQAANIDPDITAAYVNRAVV